MKAWLLCANALTVCCLFLSGPDTVNGCSCVAGALSRSRRDVIMDDYCGSPMVYTARVVGATCNCRGAAVNNTLQLQCHDYQQLEGSTNVDATVIAQGTCEKQDYNYVVDVLDDCANLSSVLSVDPGVSISDAANLTSLNLTGQSRCSLPCSFYNTSFEEYDQPCFYTVEVVEAFKQPSNNMSLLQSGSTLRVPGPNVLITCVNPSTRLQINEVYIVGVGGFCSSISAWSNLEEFSQDEVNLLRQLRTSDELGVLDCGALGDIPSIAISLLALLIALFAQ